MGKARVYVSSGLLGKLLHFPEGHTIERIVQVTPETIELTIEGETLPKEVADFPLPIVEAIFEDGAAFIRFK